MFNLAHLLCSDSTHTELNHTVSVEVVVNPSGLVGHLNVHVGDTCEFRLLVCGFAVSDVSSLTMRSVYRQLFDCAMWTGLYIS